ncbi:outer membrane protein [Pseudaminobacter sp. NGMCC 1.201702]|uniref:outer membrane protein n=1 Tax=Pseudaminobacter sp. NGMCC 1.201702 TaxID=3391825 RepID=UPI0039F14C03
MKSVVKACFIWAALSSTPAMAADDLISATGPDASPKLEEGWTYSVTPYFWAAGLSGQTSQFNLPVVEIDASFSDIFSNLDFAAMLIVEARNGRYSLFGDLMYTKLSSGAATPLGIAATTVEVDTSSFAGLAGAGYSVLEGSAGRLDVVGAVRVWSVDTEISFSGAFLDGQTRSDSATWVDGLIGVRGNYAFTPRFYAMGWGLVGAGGADIDWDVMAGVGYNINETFSATFGYRALGVDYSNDGFLFDVVQQGPIAGLTIRF